MSKALCEKCNHQFEWSSEIGLNVKYFEAKATREGFRGGGDRPICPKCESMATQLPKYAEVKITKRYYSAHPFTVSKRNKD